MTDRESIEKAVVSSILQGGEKVQDLCSEYGITPQHFENPILRLAYALIRNDPDSVHECPDDIASFVPDSGNARYYIEELSSLQ